MTGLIIVVVLAAIVSPILTHFLTRQHLLAATASKSVFLKCSVCKLLVARYEQIDDNTIRCVNCTRAEELRNKRKK